MHKAYDCVEWVYLEKTMLKLGFDQRWVKLIMSCVTSVSYNVRFNGMETEVFTPTQGLRQGDPLSPYLFLIVVEGLSSMLHGAESIGELEGGGSMQKSAGYISFIFCRRFSHSHACR